MQCYPGVELAAALKDLQVVNFLTDNELVVNTIQRYSLRWFLGPVLAEPATNHLRNATFNHQGRAVPTNWRPLCETRQGPKI